MTEATKQVLEQFVLQMIEAAKTGASWTAEQTPLLVQEWLRWQLAEASLYLIGGLILFVVSAATMERAWRFSTDNDVPLVMFNVIALPIGFLMAVVHMPIVLKILVAPRVVVFEKFLELVK